MGKTEFEIDSKFLSAVFLTIAAHGISMDDVIIDTKKRIVDINKPRMSQGEKLAFLADLHKATGGFD